MYLKVWQMNASSLFFVLFSLNGRLPGVKKVGITFHVTVKPSYSGLICQQQIVLYIEKSTISRNFVEQIQNREHFFATKARNSTISWSTISRFHCKFEPENFNTPKNVWYLLILYDFQRTLGIANLTCDSSSSSDSSLSLWLSGRCEWWCECEWGIWQTPCNKSPRIALKATANPATIIMISPSTSNSLFIIRCIDR